VSRNRKATALGMGGAGLGALVIAAVVSASAPAGRYQLDVDTIFDTKTQLTWQRLQPSDMMTQANASAYCLGLSLEGSGWRLPAVKELSSLVDVSLKGPAIDPVFTGATADSFWSASPVAGPPNSGWAVRFGSGDAFRDDATNLYSVRCVR
jgi:hypothetical protein